ITHEIKSGDSSVLSKRLQFVRVTPNGKASFAGWAPHLDYEPLDAADRPLLTDDRAAGKDVRLNLDNTQRLINDLEGRLENRKKELQSMRHVTNGTPVVLGGALVGALVVPIGLLRQLLGEPAPDPAPAPLSADPAARSHIELLAMNAVRRAEEARGCYVVDVSAQKCGWDITSYGPLPKDHPSSFILHPSSFIPHPSSLILPSRPATSKSQVASGERPP
ncbi:MAG: hypothetical protein NTZ05_11515, partial [Chloroflexi bacterium]|nr:hypothetical protein [Chloroflexota bacterium]